MGDLQNIRMQVDALCVNEALLHRDAFRSWSYQYENIAHFGSAEPQAFDSQENRKNTGITVHWVLPRSLRTDDALVPNRWKVEVLDAQTQECVAAWIVESDCPNSARQKKMAPKQVESTGSNYLLTQQQMQSFRASGDPLRAGAEMMQWGDGYTCQMGAVFPADTWEERSDMDLFLQASAPANPAFSQFIPHCRNIFSVTFSPEEQKAVYDITVTGWYSVPPLGQDNVVCRGKLYQVAWDLKGGLPEGDPLKELADSGKMNVSVGNSPFEALAAMLGQQMPEGKRGLYEALEAVLLNSQDTLQTVDGDLRRAQKAHNMSFRGKHAAIRYVFSEQPEKREAASQELGQKPEGREDVLQELNQKQEELERESRKLCQFQRELFDMWWKRGRFPEFPPVPGHSKDEFAPFFDTENDNSLISRTVRQYERVKEKKANMPQVPSNVKAVPTKNFYSPQNPVMLLLGLNPPSGLGYEDGEPEEKYRVTWEPMYMEWRVGYCHIPLEEKSWELTRQGYQLRPGVSGSPVQEYGGVSLLGRQTQEHFAKRLEDIPKKEEALEKLIGELKTLPMLTVELQGFHEKLLQRDVRCFAMPSEETIYCQGKEYSLSEIIGGEIETAPFINWNVLNPFYGIRGGQMLVKDVILYDKFGRCLNVVRSGDYSGLLFDQHFRALPFDSMKPSYTVYPNADYPLELKPRLLQAARLETSIERVEGVVLVNELDHSLEVFSESGKALGVILLDGEAGQTCRREAPGRSLSDNKAQENVSAMTSWMNAWTGRPVQEYWQFLDHVDNALYDSKFRLHDLTGMSIYFSRPMALIKVRISCVLDEAPCRPQDWDSTFSPGGRMDVGVQIPFLVGNLQDAGDGLVGHYAAPSFQQMYMPGQQADIRLSPGQHPEPEYIYLLMDFSLPVYIHTDLLPAAKINMEEEAAQNLLDRLELSLPITPLLSWMEGEALILPPISNTDDFCFAGLEEGQAKGRLAAMKGYRRATEALVEVFEGYLVKKEEREEVGDGLGD